jgi:hypothetical protein
VSVGGIAVVQGFLIATKGVHVRVLERYCSQCCFPLPRNEQMTIWVVAGCCIGIAGNFEMDFAGLETSTVAEADSGFRCELHGQQQSPHCSPRLDNCPPACLRRRDSVRAVSPERCPHLLTNGLDTTRTPSRALSPEERVLSEVLSFSGFEYNESYELESAVVEVGW